MTNDMPYRGYLDHAEFVVDPKNKNSTPRQIGDVLEYYMEILKDEDWSMFRFFMMTGMRYIRERAERKMKGRRSVISKEKK